jgi:membrane-associated protease RseP (regulator of RpoE activity)
VENPSPSLILARKWLVHGGLFVMTFFTTTVAGVAWLNLDPFELTNFPAGLPYSFSILLVLGMHEFGHYFASRFHGVNATLPFFIPFPAIPGFINFGTLGAVIKTKSLIPDKKAMFDIGAAGPIAGFIGSIGLIIYGLVTLPGIGYLHQIHPEYIGLEVLPSGSLTFGNSLLYSLVTKIIPTPPGSYLPAMNEIYHYPSLCVGWFGLFVTAMNLLPIGQLDGGHISYTLFDTHHGILARIVFGIILVVGVLGFLPIIGVMVPVGWTGWVFWALILFFIVKLDHPVIADPTPLDPARRLLGWICFAILVLSFSPSPFLLL